MPSREWRRLTEEEILIITEYQDGIPVQLGAMARALGVEVRSATLAPGISGELRPTGNGYVIRVNRHDPPVRQRFTVAHELAHFLLHKDQIGTGIEDDVLYRSGLSDRREAEANRLAADILMPEDQVREAFASVRGLDYEAIALRLANQFGVSEAAMRIRLGLQ